MAGMGLLVKKGQQLLQGPKLPLFAELVIEGHYEKPGFGRSFRLIQVAGFAAYFIAGNGAQQDLRFKHGYPIITEQHYANKRT
jgi:hypothetical protein